MVSSGYNWGTPIRPWSGGADAYVAKFNAMGALLWNTFLGGSQDDYAKGISLDASGNIYLAGESDATWGSPIRPYVNSRDAFAARLDPTGALLWNTFLGGAGFDRGSELHPTPEATPVSRAGAMTLGERLLTLTGEAGMCTPPG